MKKCSICLKEKKETDFWKNKNTKDKLNNRCIQCISKKRKKWKPYQENLFKKYQRNAQRRHLDFFLSEEEFLSFSNSDCYYCGIKLDQVRLDRVDNKIGYMIGNVVPCCVICNHLKGTLKLEVFLDHIIKICSYQKVKTNDKQEDIGKKTC